MLDTVQSDSCTTAETCQQLQQLIELPTNVDASGFNQWHNAMRMVARLPGGIPADFRQKLWLMLAERNLQRRQIDWEETCRVCFSEHYNPEDEELGTQIVRDLHRTGCSLFNEDELANQALLKKVLLAYARWNKSVGYCQGFNMLAAIIIEVMEGDVSDSLKILIYLIENVLPESYFANNLRGLSVDMIVFRDLMHVKLSELARHLDYLQYESFDQTVGFNYEPPLINVFTMQWFLTLFSNCLPKSTILRIWDLIFLEGNEILLRTAMAIWDCLADRILTVKSADEFYCIMDVLTREIMEFGITDTNELITIICNMASFPFPQLAELREKYTYNIRPFSSSIYQLKNSFVNMLNNSVQRLIDDDEEDGVQNWFEDQFMVVNWCLNNTARSRNSPAKGNTPVSPMNGSNLIDSFLKQIQGGNNRNLLTEPNESKSSIDISLLKKQYQKLKQRQQQAQQIVSESLQSVSKNESSEEKFSMSRLLTSKTALIKRKSKLDFCFSPRKYKTKNGLFTRANTISSIVTTTITSPPVKISINESESQQELTNRYDLLTVQPRIVKRSSSSSTSTELCDEAMGIDCKSDYECDDEVEEYGNELRPREFHRRHSKSCDNFTSSSFEEEEEEKLPPPPPPPATIDAPRTTEEDDEVFGKAFVEVDLNDNPLDDCIRRFQDQIMQIKLEQNIP